MAKYLISAGHGGGDPGNTANGRREADICLELRDIGAMKLRAKGHDVMTDGARSENLSLGQAIKMIVSSRTCIEIHTNAGAPTARGVETIGTVNQARLCRAISQGIAGVLGTTTRRSSGWFDYEQLKK